MARIAIFDSGVGGLSIYKEIKYQLPDCQYIFVSDNQAFPYGTKAEHELTERVLEVVSRIVNQFSPDILVIACNTASTVVLPLLREKFKFPIVGVVPAIKPAAQLTKSNVIGLLATPATIKRQYTSQLIKDFAPDCDVIKVGSSELVQIAEDKLYGCVVNQQSIRTEIEAFLEADNIDVIVLACTHFPLLNKEIDSLLKVKYPVKLVDSGKGIANRVAQLLTEIPVSNRLAEPSFAVFTDSENVTTELKNTLNKIEFDTITTLN